MSSLMAPAIWASWCGVYPTHKPTPMMKGRHKVAFRTHLTHFLAFANTRVENKQSTKLTRGDQLQQLIDGHFNAVHLRPHSEHRAHATNRTLASTMGVMVLPLATASETNLANQRSGLKG